MSEENETIECHYCGYDAPEIDAVPDVNDDEAWLALEADHDPDCEWICTRAHRRDFRRRWVEWTVKIRVSENWVEDGFDLDADRLQSMLENTLPLAYSHEVEGEVVTAPDPKEIRRIQGYTESQEQPT